MSICLTHKSFQVGEQNLNLRRINSPIEKKAIILFDQRMKILKGNSSFHEWMI